ncbi:1,4-alpha-glucan branching protein GlgB [Mucilaginibacter arboris]|uniref:1,4-alpha-glucan branching enzyme GlgB n=1 Tax=Mucilaginibacter arboris TaxID=2682090 RepID=A0A7K1STM6_9SPHI|nr:1,4-alpha-glucan branching protein GlgB [Mucilaginibacter arboris]MVN20651.1 1,4-alpha-glucan branching protein GlgB [Mucilaginibacter arboris]
MAKKSISGKDETVNKTASAKEKKVPAPKKVPVKTVSSNKKNKKAEDTALQPSVETAGIILAEPDIVKPESVHLNAVEVYSRFSDFDINLFKAGKHYKLYELLGSHTMEHKGTVGTYFAVWAPNAQEVAVIGNFNGWNKNSHKLFIRWDGSGIWEGFIPHVGHNETYKYLIRSFYGEELEKGDPFALRWEEPPRTASIVTHTYFEWDDQDWMKKRVQHNALTKPYSVYEVHFGSWARSPESPEQFLDYRQMAAVMVKYVKDMGFTHVEFMPLAEHPYYPSWGYQITGYFAASTRYGSPQDLMYLISEFHKADIGVIMDWVPSHFPGDAHGLFKFDGTSLYEHEDARKGFHPDWKSYIFNYGRNEVKSFLISNALFWLDRYHIDGLRVDAVASMLYLDYSRNAGEWEPNVYGGNENLEAIHFLREFNEAVYSHYPDVQTIAEESTSFPGVSKPTFMGGLGFGMKWMMGWMHDTIKYFHEDPINRKYHHQQITFSLLYAFTENFMLPLSHDEIVYGKHAMINKMPGDEWQRFANLRVLYSYMFTHPGTKLLFMGDEFAQTEEWKFDQSLDWHLLEYRPHKGMQDLVKALNHLYKSEPALYEKAFSGEGFEWIDDGNAADSVLIYVRKGNLPENNLVVVLNFTPVVREGHRVGVPEAGTWKEIFNSDELHFWGSGTVNPKKLKTEAVGWNYREQSIKLNLPPLGVSVLKKVR